ncbi:MAG: phosphatase PAP2 family protein [Oscillospiraceae bacterium]|nr:phosphatase PAP2 family protein [Oscillospiraceae bacterium]
MLTAIDSFDKSIIRWVDSISFPPVIDSLFQLVSRIAYEVAIWLVFAAIVFVFTRNKIPAIAMVCSLIIAFVLVQDVIKPLIERPRPYNVIENLNLLVATRDTSSFPSGHTTGAVAAAVTFFRLSKSNLRYGLIVFAWLVAVSRVYLKMHYVTDVLAGIALGFGIGLLVSLLVRKWLERYRRSRHA